MAGLTSEPLRVGGRADRAIARPLRVAVVCESQPETHDGVGRYSQWLAEVLRNGGHAVTELRPVDDGAAVSPLRRASVSLPANGNRISVPVWPWRVSAASMMDLDVVHVQAPFSPFLTGRIVRDLPSHVAVVATFHSTPRDHRATFALRALAAVQRRTLGRVDATLAVSPSAAHAAASTHRMSCRVIDPLVPDPSSLAGGVPAAPGAIAGRILFAGRLVARKGVLQLLAVLADAKNDEPDWHLHIVGDGPLRQRLIRMVRDLKLDDRVRLLGALPQDELRKELERAQVVCAPSTNGESFGLVLIEAMLAGAVVLGGSNEGHRYVLGTEQVADVRDRKAYRHLLSLHLTEANARRAALARQERRLATMRAGVGLPALLDVYEMAIAARSARVTAERTRQP